VPRLLIATMNPGKMMELRALLADLPVSLVSPDDLGVHVHVTEDGTTYVDNAVKKAEAFAAASGLASLADDTGLEVQALDGAPGLRSRRYLPDDKASDADRRTFLLRNLTGRQRPWLACFRAAVAVSSPRGEMHWTVGECEGEIIPEERGQGGFGYDPVFLVRGMGLTMAELDLATKNSISHRSRAVSRALPFLRGLFQ
jgi:XTP/dITP diphosphohydrolase